jgi:hypothetical protein
MHIKEAIMNMLDEKYSAMKENFEKVIKQKVAQRLEEKKIVVAQDFFGKK